MGQESSQTGEVKVFARKTVVKRRKTRLEMLLSEARKHKPEAQVGDVLEVEATPEDAGRIAAQTAKQVILQRLREAERDAIFGEYADKEGDIVSGVVHAVEAKHVAIDLGKAEGILPQAEQMAADHYRIGQRLKLYLMKVMRTARGTQLILSRTHQGLLRRSSNVRFRIYLTVRWRSRRWLRAEAFGAKSPWPLARRVWTWWAPPGAPQHQDPEHNQGAGRRER